MTKSVPPVAVVMPVHNAAAFVTESVQSLLTQTYSAFEIIVIDDSSTDDTPHILRSFRDPRLRLFTNPTNLGVAASLNRGLTLTDAPYIARHDADDISLPHRLSRQYSFLNDHPSYALVGSQLLTIDAQGRTLQRSPPPRPTTQGGIAWELCTGNPFSHPTVMFRRDVVVNNLHGYDEAANGAEDLELWHRITRVAPATNLLEPLIRFRLHQDSVTARYRPSRFRNCITLRARILAELAPSLGSPALSARTICALLQRPRFTSARESAAACTFLHRLRKTFRVHNTHWHDVRLHCAVAFLRLARKTFRTFPCIAARSVAIAFVDSPSLVLRRLLAARWTPKR